MKVYFDNAATSPVHPKVFEKMKMYITENFGNPSSLHSFGRSARVAIENSREIIASLINADAGEIYFTSGGTEANNFTVSGIARTEFSENAKDTIITSKAEHNCIINTCNELKRIGFNVKFLEVDNSSIINLDDLKRTLDTSTSMVSFIHVNNETGSINPLEHIGDIISNHNVYFHTDAVQSFGKFNIDVKKLSINSLTASAHKIGGPKGVGFAYVKSGTPIKPLIFGGSQERNRRGGTENVAGIVGLAEAALISQNEMDNNFNHVTFLRNEFILGIESIGRNSIRINGGKNSSPFILSITFLSEYYKNDAEAMLMFLDINGIAASNGAACTSGTLKPSHVIINSGFSEADASGTIRFSFSYQNSIEEVYYTLDVIKKMIKKFEK